MNLSWRASALRPGTGSTRQGRGLSPRLVVAVLIAAATALMVALLVVAVEGAWAPLRHLDQSVADNLHIQALAHPAWTRAMLWVSTIGSPTVMRVGSAVLAIVLWVRGARRLASWVAATMIGGALIDVLLKTVIGRARPVFAHPVVTAPGFSFPSGHAFTSALAVGVVLLCILPLLHRRSHKAVAWLCALAIVAAVGYSRIALGVHWVSDVIGGWLLGVGLLAATTAAFEAWRRDHARPSVHPASEGVAPEESEAAAHASSTPDGAVAENPGD